MTETSPQVIVLAGPNGAGKTTLAPFLLRDQLGVLEYVNADPIALGLSGFDAGSVAFEAGRVMLRRLQDLSGQRRTFAFETTLAARSYARWISGLRERGYRFQLSFVWLRSADLALERVHARVRTGGHNVAEEIIRRRFRNGLKNLWRLYMPLADAWSVYDNSWPSDPVLIGSGGTNRTVEIIQPEYWEEFSHTNP